MTDKEKIMKCFTEVLANKKAGIKDSKYDNYDVIELKFQNKNTGQINDTWFTFDKNGDLIDIY
jgi:hypothetical protein